MTDGILPRFQTAPFRGYNHKRNITGNDFHFICVSLGGSQGSLIYSQYDGRAQKYNKLNGMPIFYNGNFSMKLINQLKQIGGKSSNIQPLTDTLL